MDTDTFKIIIHIVASVDGIIAKKDNSIGWFDTHDDYEQGVVHTEEDTANFLKTIDCYIMGARTYEHALQLSKLYGWPYGDIPTVVLSHNDLPIERTNVQIYSGDLEQFVHEKLKPNYQNVWLVGGAMLAQDFIRLKLADELRLSIMPVILGEGIPFFETIAREQTLHLKNVTPYKSGMVELHYEIKK